MSRVRVPDGAPSLLTYFLYVDICGPLVKWPKTPASHAGNTSSNLVRVTKFFLKYALIAQSVEHAAVNRRVVGSSPTIGAKNPVHESGRDFYFLLITSSLLPKKNKVFHGIFGK